MQHTSGSIAAALTEARRHHAAGNLQGAEASYRHILAQQPDHPDALDGLGLIGLRLGRAEAALDLFRRALGRNPRSAPYNTHEGLALAALGRYEEAISSFQKALKTDGRFPEALFNLGVCFLTTGRAGDAVAPLKRTALIARNRPDVLNALGAALQATGASTEAEAAFRSALEAEPGFTKVLYNLATLLLDDARPEEALPITRTLHQAAPNAVDGIALLGRALTRTGQPGEAIAVLAPARTRHPEAEAIGTALAEAFMNAGADGDAAALYTELIATAEAGGAPPERIADLRYSRGVLAMGRGRFAEGLKDYEARWAMPGNLPPSHTAALPAWNGGPLPDGGRLLIWAEQGIGDHVLYGSLLRAVIERLGTPAAVVFECDPRLGELFRRAFPDVEVVGEGEGGSRPGLAAQIAMGGLMRALAPWPEGAPAAAPFVNPAPERVADFRAWLDALGGGPKIGISWHSTRKRMGAIKTAPLSLWRPILAGRNAQFINLQYGETDGDIAEAAKFGCTVHTVPGLDRFADLNGLAALIAALDLVVTTTNVTPHLTGALGTPGRLMVPRAPQWYWGRNGASTPFYPSLTLYRQARLGRWEDVIAAVAADLDRDLG